LKESRLLHEKVKNEEVNATQILVHIASYSANASTSAPKTNDGINTDTSLCNYKQRSQFTTISIVFGIIIVKVIVIPIAMQCYEPHLINMFLNNGGS
jgi:hypothetical protein